MKDKNEYTIDGLDGPADFQPAEAMFTLYRIAFHSVAKTIFRLHWERYGFGAEQQRTAPKIVPLLKVVRPVSNRFSGRIPWNSVETFEFKVGLFFIFVIIRAFLDNNICFFTRGSISQIQLIFT